MFYGGGSGGGYLIGSGIDNLSGDKHGSAHVLTGRNFLGDVEGMATGSGPNQYGRIGGLVGGIAGGYEGLGSENGGSSWGGWSLGAGNKQVPFMSNASGASPSTAQSASSSSGILSALSGLMGMGGSGGSGAAAGSGGGTGGGSMLGGLGGILGGMNSANQQQAKAIQPEQPQITLDPAAMPKLLQPSQDPLQLAIANLLAQRIGYGQHA